MAGSVAFTPVSRALRAAIIEHFEARGEDLDNDKGLRTLDTNSSLAPHRADLLVHTFLARSGHSTLENVRIADFGCGFGSLALVLAARGAQVIGIDPNAERMHVGASIARDFGLDARFFPGTFADADLGPESIDLALVNNSLCYVVSRSDRLTALRGIHETLVPGGWAVLRNPSQSHPKDPFTGWPLVHRLPPRVCNRVLAVGGVHRSDVRLTTPRAALRELRRTRFIDVRFDGSGGPRRARDRLAGYHHVSGRKPLHG
jgi:SAM-dependent methyltransferase